MVRINGARVLLTGATGGIGQAIARRLKADGGQLVLTGRRAEVRLGARLGALAPGLNAAIQRRAGAADFVGNHAGNH